MDTFDEEPLEDDPPKQRRIKGNSELAELLEIYGVYIDYIRHENTLIKDRTIIFMATQFVLLAAMGFCFQQIFQKEYNLEKIFGVNPPIYDTLKFMLTQENSVYYRYMIAVLSAFGALSGFLGFRSIAAAKTAQNETYKAWRQPRGDHPSFCELAVKYNLPALMGGGQELVNDKDNLRANRIRLGSLLNRMIPLILCASWVLLFGLIVALLPWTFKV